MKREATTAWMLAAVLLAGAAAARADTVTLVNGDRLSGTVEHLSADTLTLTTSYAGKIKIRRSEVATLETDRAVDLLLEGVERPVSARLAGATTGRVELEPAPAGWATDVPLARVTHVNPTPVESGIGVAYKGRVNLSSARTSGNSSSSRMYGEAELTARAKLYRYAIGVKGLRATDSGTETASSWLGNGNYDHFISKDRFLYGRGSLERDRFRDIDLRTTVGGGYGLQLYDTDRTHLSVRGGIDLVMLERTGGLRTTHPALGWGVRFSHWLWQRSVQLFHDQDGFWDLEDTRQVTLRSRTGLRVPIAQGLSANAQLNVDWEREPAPGRKSTDSTLLLGLGYEW